MTAALKPLLLCLSHFRKGMNSSLARRHWLEQGAGGRCWGVLAYFFSLICFVLPDLAVPVSLFLILTWGILFSVPFERLSSEVLLCVLACVSTGTACLCLQEVLERNWEQQMFPDPPAPTTHGQPVCPTGQGLLCLRMYYPNTHGALTYSMYLPKCYGGQRFAILGLWSQMCYLTGPYIWSQEQP